MRSLLCHSCFIVWFVAILFSCNQQPVSTYTPPENALFTRIDSSESGMGFVNAVEDGEEYNILTYRNFYNGGGVAIGDINNDGLADVLLTANLGESKLYLNQGGFTFKDITSSSGIRSKRGWRTGVTMADVNADGWLDIYICNSGDIKGDNKENELYINQHNNTFIEQARELGLNDPGYTTHVSFFDYDLDNDLDCYILNNSFVDVRKFDIEAARKVRDTMGGHKLLRNDNGVFHDVSEYANIAGSKIAYGLGVSVGDVNGDMYPDIYVSNDFYEKDYLYINQRNGKFSDEMPRRMGHISSSSMGADIADLNNDGYMDIVTTDMLPEEEYRVKTLTRFEQYHMEDMKFRYSFHYQYPQNALQLNRGDGSFYETAFLSGIAATDWSWGALSFDFENDGQKDIYISNGVYRDISDMDFSDFLANKKNIEKVVSKKDKFDFRDFFPYIPSTRLPNYAYVNQGDLRFANKSRELGLGQPSFSNGVAYGDLDNDGDMDLVVNNINDACFLYRNEASQKAGNHFLRIKLKGHDKNPFGIGTWINLYTKNGRQVIQHVPVRSFQSCVDNILIFGTGKETMIDSLEVIWPDLKRQLLKAVPADKELVLNYGEATQQFLPQPLPTPLFNDRTAGLLSNPVQHQENRYNDFDSEILITHMLSTQGPKLAEGDVNGDGKTDIFLGGAAGEPGKILIQKTSGWTWVPQKIFESDKDMEDAGAVLVDIDNDKDNDLLVASGGYQYDQGSSLLATRLYLNNGKGDFTKADFPQVATNASCIRVADINKDGYPDVFIGGRAITGKYGLPGESVLLINQQGKFSIQTPPSLKSCGMITDAAWTDIDNNGYPDLVVVGEWMPVTYFLNKNGVLEAARQVPQTAGLWNCITATDIDKDGDTDFALGNWGNNTQFKASSEKPMRLYVNDFDKNGTSECILSYYWPDGKPHLYHAKTDLTAQLPSLKKKFLLFKDYANKAIEEVFDEKQLTESAQLKTEALTSSLLINKGALSFELKPLPVLIQSTAVFAITASDFNRDGHTDLVIGGNFYDIKPDLGRLDANALAMLAGDGKGGFRFLSPQESGLSTDGQVRDIRLVKMNNFETMLVAKNNGPLQLFTTRNK